MGKRENYDKFCPKYNRICYDPVLFPCSLSPQVTHLILVFNPNCATLFNYSPHTTLQSPQSAPAGGACCTGAESCPCWSCTPSAGRQTPLQPPSRDTGQRAAWRPQTGSVAPLPVGGHTPGDLLLGLRDAGLDGGVDLPQIVLRLLRLGGNILLNRRRRLPAVVALLRVLE